MIEIKEILNVNGSVYDVNMDKIKEQMRQTYGDDIRLGYSFRTDEPDQVTVYKVIKEDEVDISRSE